jgi:uncharacterized membrane protein
MTSSRSSSYLPSKRPKTAVAGPYGHPFHPMMVTVPIGCWVASLVFDIVSKSSDSNASAFARGSAWLIGIGIVGALVAAALGLMDFMTVPKGTRARRIGLTHMLINSVVLVLFVVDLLVRRSQGFDRVRTGPLVLTVVALVLLGVSGWLGGQLSYRYGVRVADELDQVEGFR